MFVCDAIDGYCCKVYKTGLLRFWKKKLIAQVEFDVDDNDVCLLTMYDDEFGALSTPTFISSSPITTRAYLMVITKR